MKRATTLVLIAATVTLSACGGGGSSGYDEPAAPVATPPPPPAAATQTNFTAFMRTQLDPAAASDAAEPTDVEGIDWVFTDDDDESEYDDVLATSM
jgi:ABC-type glycerol-3-phosphate transport system substrate-binding protein